MPATYLGDRVKRAIDVEDALWVAWDGFRDHDFRAALVPDFVDVLAASADDNGGVLGDDEAAHVDVGGGHRGRASSETRGRAWSVGGWVHLWLDHGCSSGSRGGRSGVVGGGRGSVRHRHVI